MTILSRRLRIKPTFKNPLSEKLKEKHENSFIKIQHYRPSSKKRHFPKT
jgi:hypothetical protein